MKRLLAYILAMCTAFVAFSQIRADSVKVYFRLGNSQFDPAFRDNREAMGGFIIKVSDALENNLIGRIEVRAYASPEGVSAVNARLSQKRCNTITDYIAEKTGINRSKIQELPGGVGWDELRNLVDTTPDVPYREKILHILDTTPLWIFDSHGKIVDGRKKQLMDLAGGRPFKWMMTNLFPEVRNAIAVVLFLKTNITEPTDTISLTEITDITEPTDATSLTEITNITGPTDATDITNKKNITDKTDITEKPDLSEKIVKTSSNRYFALKTNMLYDAAMVPNIDLEVYTGKNISLHGEWMYSWWANRPRHRYWRIYGGNLGARWWFGSKAKAKPLTGHHLGIYGGILIFDFEWGNTGYMGGKPGGTLWDRCLINSGVEYGYSLPVWRRLNIDFSIGLGYLGGNYIKYFPFDNEYFREKEYKLRFFGPTKVEISLVWLLGHGNINRKGGEQ